MAIKLIELIYVIATKQYNSNNSIIKKSNSTKIFIKRNIINDRSIENKVNYSYTCRHNTVIYYCLLFCFVSYLF